MELPWWSLIVQGIVILLAIVCLYLFTIERRERSLPETPTVSSIFSNPYLRILGILLMMFIVLHSESQQSGTQASESGLERLIPSLVGVIVFIIGATVAGADFILLMIALLKNNDTFIKEHFALERERAGFTASGAVHVSPEKVKVETPDLLEPESAQPEPEIEGEIAARELEAKPIQAPFKQIIEQPALERLNLVAARALITEERQVRVAVVSTGFDPALGQHIALTDRIEPIFIAPGASPGRMGDTGTTALGYIGAIAPTSTIFPVSVFDESNYTEEDWILNGVRAAIHWSPDVILLEFGSPGRLERLGALIKQYSNSILFVAPAGNQGTHQAIYPAAENFVIGVSATTARGELAAFSSFGPGVSIAAPGVDVLSLTGASANALVFQKMSGTSMAAGLAVAVISLALSANIEISPPELTRFLIDTGRPIKGHPNIHLLDAEKLIQRVIGK